MVFDADVRSISIRLRPEHSLHAKALLERLLCSGTVVAFGASNVCIECETRHPSSMSDLLRPALVFTQPK